MQNYTFDPKKVKVWVMINLGVLTAFVVGNIYNIPFIKLVGELGLWFAAIAGTLTLIVIAIHNKIKDKFNLRFVLVKDQEEDKIPEYRELLKKHHSDTTALLFDEGRVKKIACGSLPLDWDMTFDIIVAIIMMSFGYVWLPLFYMIHILGYYIMRTKALRFYRKANYFNPEDYKEGDENA
jgi:hypothetical protein